MGADRGRPGRSVRRRPADRPAPRAARSMPSSCSGPSTTARLQPGLVRVGVRREDRRPAPASLRPCRRISSGRTPCRGPACRSRVATASGSRDLAQRVDPPRPGHSTSRKARTVEAVPTHRLGASRGWPHGARTEGRSTPSPCSSPSRTSRRTSTSRLSGSSSRRGRRGRGSAAARTCSTAGRAEAGTVSSRSPSSRRSRSPAGTGTQTLPGRRARPVSSSRSATASRSSSPPRSSGGRDVRNRCACSRATVVRVDPGERVGQRRRPARRAPAARLRGSSRYPAGSGSSSSRRPSSAVTRRAPSSPRQVSWLMPMVTCSETPTPRCARHAGCRWAGTCQCPAPAAPVRSPSPPRRGSPTACGRRSGTRTRRGCPRARRSPATRAV